MGDPTLGTQQSETSAQDRLDSWKEIASYLKRDVTTVQRWEKREGMPVHRHLHDKVGSVYTSRTELDAWVRSRNPPTTQETESPTPSPQQPALPPQSPRSLPRKLAVALAILVVLAIALGLWLRNTERFWRNPLTDAKVQIIADFVGVEQSAAISPDGRLVAFLSDRDGQTDVWITQVGSGEFHNLTHGSIRELANPSIRDLGFSPDQSVVTFWVRKQDSSGSDTIGVWAVPTLGGEPRVYLDGVAEFDWSHDASRLAYHTPGPGDPLFVSDRGTRADSRLIYSAPAGLHSHFPLWAPDSAFLYFVRGELPDKLDIWRIRPTGGTPERITSQNQQIAYPILLDSRTLMYLANDAATPGPSLYSIDVEHRIPHRLTSGLDRYTSLAASADGRRLVVTRTTPQSTLWRVSIADPPAPVSKADSIPLTTSTGSSPRLGPGYLLYVSSTGISESIWKLANGSSAELWRGEGAQVFGGPSISPDGRRIAFSVRQNGKPLLCVMQADGTNAKIIADSLDLQDAPAWAPDGKSILAAALDHGVPHLFRVPIDGRAPALFLHDYSLDPVSSPDGSIVAYSGPDIGTTFAVKAVAANAAPLPFPSLTLTRGARHLAFLAGGRSLVVLRGDIQHKDLWLINLDTGAQLQLTSLPPDFEVKDFDISPDGREVVFERVQQRSDLVLFDLARH